MAKYDCFELLQTKVMDRLIKQIWETNIDHNGSVLSTSTCWNILKKLSSRFEKDYERNHRLSKKRDLDKIEMHSLNFMVYIKSMHLRYHIELMLFVVLMILFQKEVIVFAQVYFGYTENMNVF